MKFKPEMVARRQNSKSRKQGGFTLVEVLAALLFMAIVIPVAVEGLRVASRAGEMAQRKAAAARVAERALGELLVSGQIQGGSQNGVQQEGGLEYRWTMRSQQWPEDTMTLVTVVVKFPVQSSEYEVALSTLLDTTTPAATATPTSTTTTAPKT